MRNTAKEIVKRLQQAGFDTFWVGGSVRDFLLGRQATINDYIRYACIGLIFIYIFIAKYQFFGAENNKLMITRIIIVLALYVVMAYLITNKILLPLLLD